jgi:NAD(P)-dependent dehydrogenase (short-subunit alcohol dehydrogenase family)
MRMKGKVAIVTGGGSGIGRASVELLAREGAQVVIGEFNEATGRAAKEAVLAAGGQAIFVPVDVSSDEQMRVLIETTIRTYGKIDVMHNNVGGSTQNDGPITKVSNDEFWLKMRVDVFGTWLGCRYAIPHMIENGGGPRSTPSSE